MRTIDRASSFKRDYKREAKGQHRATLDDELKPILVALATDQPLDARYRDHDLSGDWAGSDFLIPRYNGWHLFRRAAEWMAPSVAGVGVVATCLVRMAHPTPRPPGVACRVRHAHLGSGGPRPMSKIVPSPFRFRPGFPREDQEI